jgi:hypothetical protein
MTFIQPTKHLNLLNIIIATLVVGILGGTFWIIVSYNKTVDLSHNIVSIKAELDTIGASSTALNNNIISTLGASNSQTLASADSLVPERNPQYFQLDQNALSLLNNR